jgi:hypothetical protein
LLAPFLEGRKPAAYFGPPPSIAGAGGASVRSFVAYALIFCSLIASKFATEPPTRR